MNQRSRVSRRWVAEACRGFPAVRAAVEGRRPERIPTILFGVNPYCASVAGVRYSDCMLDQDVYVESIVTLARRFKPDALLNVGSGIDKGVLARTDVVEVDGVRFLRDRESGERVMRVADDGNPQMLRDGHLLAQSNAVKRPNPDAIVTPSPERLAEAPWLGVARRVLSQISDKTLVSRGVCNASNTVVAWLGFEQTCMLMRADPGYVKALAERATATACAQVRAQAMIGLRLFYTGGSWGSLVGPREYETFFAESQVAINRTIHDSGALALLHLTGRQGHLVDANLASEPDIVLADQDDLAEVVAAYRGRACVAGAVEPSRLLLPGPPERIHREVGEQITWAGPAGFMVSTTDCIVKDTPPEHVDAMLAAAGSAMP